MYDFTTMLDRTASDAIAVQVVHVKGVEVREGFSKIPMWVADMNFVGCPSIDAALAERIKTPAYGYFITRAEYYDSIIRWQAERHGLEGLTKDMIGYENGVLGGVVSALRVFCCEGGKVLLHTPTYIGFTGSLKRNGFEIVHSPLRLDGNGVWRMDFEDMEKKIKDNHIHAAVIQQHRSACVTRPVGRYRLVYPRRLSHEFQILVVLHVTQHGQLAAVLLQDVLRSFQQQERELHASLSSLRRIDAHVRAQGIFAALDGREVESNQIDVTQTSVRLEHE